MDTDLDIRTLATRLVTELGERAPPFNRMRWVALTASGPFRVLRFDPEQKRATTEKGPAIACQTQILSRAEPFGTVT